MQRAVKALLLLQLILFAVANYTIAQEFSFRKIGVEDGLSQSVATTMIQDKQGALWIGSMSGLSHYNGHTISTYTETDGLAEDWVTASYRDREGNLWFGHWGGGVTIRDHDKPVFKNLGFEKYSDFKTITDIIEDEQGNLWFATDGAGIFFYEIGSQSIVTITSKDGFISDAVYAFCKDAGNNIWIGTQKGIAIYHVDKEISARGAFSQINAEDGLSSNLINDLQLLKDGSILAATPINGLNQISNTSGKYKITHHNRSNGLSSDQINCILQDSHQNIWIGTKDKGVAKLDPESGHIQEFSTRQGLNYFNIRSLYEDREQNIWIGTDLGVNLFKGEQFLIFNERDGILNNIIWAVAEDHDQNIWLGTNAGLSRITFNDAENNADQQLKVQNFTEEDGLNHEIILSVFPDKNGRVWCGTGWGGVNVLENGQFRVIDQSDGLVSNTVFSIAQDKEGDLWFGTSEGATKYNPSTGSIVNYDENDGLGGQHIYKIFRDSKDRLWFSVLGGNLSVYANGNFTQFDSSMGLGEKFITCIGEDMKGNIWLGAYGSGIYKYDGQQFTHYSANDGLSSNVPYSITCDNENHLWIGTTKGIDQFNQDDGLFRNYRKKEGFMGVEPNPNAIFKDRQGNIWVGTIMGAVKFDLSKKRINKEAPIMVINQPEINHQPVSLPENRELSYEQNNITFNYLGVGLNNPQHIKYQYKLEGIDKDWSPVIRLMHATYSNLPPGDYQFQVKASNGDGIWTTSPATLQFSISPPFWKTWWFYTICFLLTIAGLYYGDKLRTYQLKAANARLEIKVAERTREIAEKNDELARKNQDILDSIKYAERIQKAILPSEHEIKIHLPHSFVFYQPKDIVSGDFYWMEVVDKGKIILAAADCTGHGVPGAFMSIIGHNGLNKVVKEEGVTKPSEILNKLSKIVEDTLKYEDNMEVIDGLDIAICAIDTNNMKLEYAGAFNPLYLVREGKLHETKADRSPVGGSVMIREKAMDFSNHVIELQEHDTFYLFSDGIADQFGGPQGRKFRYKQVKELFISSAGHPMPKQKELIDEAIQSWKGEIDQIDDMVVIGVKII